MLSSKLEPMQHLFKTTMYKNYFGIALKKSCATNTVIFYICPVLFNNNYLSLCSQILNDASVSDI